MFPELGLAHKAERPTKGIVGASAASRYLAIQLPPLRFSGNGPPRGERRAREGRLPPVTCIPPRKDSNYPSRLVRRLQASVVPQLSV